MLSKKIYLPFIAFSFVFLTNASFLKAREEQKSSCEFAIIVPSFNNQHYYEENLDSIFAQESTNPYHVYYINDASTDGTGKLVQDYVKKHQLEKKITIINNPVNKGAGYNTFNTVHTYIADHKICVIMDGDDKFAHHKALLTLEKYYADPDIWVTHGRLRTFPEGRVIGDAIPEWIIKQNKIRQEAWPTAIRTFRAALYKKVRKQDFYYKGEFIKVAHDNCFMLALLEMSCPLYGIGKRHFAFVDEILYLYRYNNPISDFRIRGDLQWKMDRHIRKLRPYAPLKSLE